MGKGSIDLAAVLATIVLFASGVGSSRCRAEAAFDEEDIALENKGYLIPATQVQVSPRVSG